jgi:glycosyltransferase involved in cell wall biosynthesis
MSRRVAILCEFPTLNGGERSLLSVLAAMPAAEWTPILLCPGNGPLAQSLTSIGVDVIPFATRDEFGQARPRETLREELRYELTRIGPQLFHANSISMGRLSGPVAAQLSLPSLSHLRDIVSLSRPAAADLNRHARLIAVSQATRDAHVAQGIDAGRTVVLHNGVDVSMFSPGAPTGFLHRQLRLPASTRLIGCIGQIILRKGQDSLVAAARALAEELPDVHYVFVGTRHSEKPETVAFEQALRAAFQSPPLLGRGTFLGVRDDIPLLLRELTLLVHPARQEPLGRVLLEAAAAGCPVVATDVGGTREIFSPGETAALLVPPDEPGQLAAAILRVLSDQVVRRSLGAQARQRAIAAFDVQASAAALIGHYNTVIDR